MPRRSRSHQNSRPKDNLRGEQIDALARLIDRINLGLSGIEKTPSFGYHPIRCFLGKKMSAVNAITAYLIRPAAPNAQRICAALRSS